MTLNEIWIVSMIPVLIFHGSITPTLMSGSLQQQCMIERLATAKKNYFSFIVKTKLLH